MYFLSLAHYVFFILSGLLCLLNIYISLDHLVIIYTITRIVHYSYLALYHMKKIAFQTKNMCFLDSFRYNNPNIGW